MTATTIAVVDQLQCGRPGGRRCDRPQLPHGCVTRRRHRPGRGFGTPPPQLNPARGGVEDPPQRRTTTCGLLANPPTTSAGGGPREGDRPSRWRPSNRAQALCGVTLSVHGPRILRRTGKVVESRSARWRRSSAPSAAARRTSRRDVAAESEATRGARASCEFSRPLAMRTAVSVSQS